LTNLLKKSMIKSNRTTETCEACSLEGFFGDGALNWINSIYGKVMIKFHSEVIKNCEM
jgi:hypothetical protein